jgi:drug/metabolite transporter (DMT)-like permease
MVYNALLVETYRGGDMSHAYPLMRGSAPLLVTLAGGPLTGERLDGVQWLAVSLICGGILALYATARAVTAAALAWALARRGRELRAFARANLPLVPLGGGATLGSYAIALWAMTLAPVAVIAALRETSILFATVIAAWVLGERIHPARVSAVALVACGAAVMPLA